MKYLLIVALLISSVSYGQTKYIIRADSTQLEKVGGNNELNLLNSTRSRTGAYLKNTLNGRTGFFYAVDSAYISGSNLVLVRGGGSQNITVPVGGGSTDTTNKWVNTIYRTPGIDSFYFNIGGNVYAIYDSSGGGGGSGTLTSVSTDDATGITGGTITTTGTLVIDTANIIATRLNVQHVIDSLAAAGGGAGNTNSNVGSAYRLAIPGTNDIKTLSAGYGVLLDSATSNQIGAKVDSAVIYSSVRTTVSDSISTVRGKTFFGTRLNAYNLSNLNDFSQSGSATWGTSSGNITVSGGAGTFTYTLNLKDTTCIERWRIYARFVAVDKDGASYGIGFGLRSTNGWTTTNALGRISLYTGGGTGDLILNGGTDNAVLNTSATALTWSAGDTIVMTVERKLDSLIATMYNYSTNSALIRVGYAYSMSASPFMPNTGTLSVFTFGGSQTIDSLNIQSQAIKYGGVIVGDSKTSGYNASTVEGRYGQQLNIPYPGTVIAAGGFDRTAEALSHVQEVIALKPHWVIYAAGSNDLRTFVTTGTWQANILSFYNQVTAAGIPCYFICPAETSIDLSTLQDYFVSVNAANTIPVYQEMLPNLASWLYVDGVHPNQAGNDFIYQVIMDYGTLFGGTNASAAVAGVTFTDGSGFDGTVTGTTTKTLALTTSLSNGRVPYIGASGALSQDNLFWDATNDRLQIGNSTPVDALSKMEVGLSQRFAVYPDYSGEGDIPASSVLIGSSTGDFSFFATTFATGDGSGTLRMAYHNGSVATSAAEVSNVPTASAGTSVLKLMKGGGITSFGTAAAGTLSYIQMNGSTSGTISIKQQAAAGTYNFNLPTTAGTSGHLLTSGGGGAAAMTWTDPSVYALYTTRLDQFATPNTDVAWGSNKITGLADPTNDNDAANKLYVDNNIAGVHYKAAREYATTAALPANTYNNGASGVGATLTAVATGTLTVDGHVMAINETLLVKNEATQANNGLYNVTVAGAIGVAYILTRAADFDQSADITIGDAVFILLGTANTLTTWVVNSASSPTMGTTAITFVQINNTASVADNSITNSKLAQMAAHTIKGNNTASTANAIDLTLAQVLAELNITTITGNAGSATILQTGRNLYGFSFNGSAPTVSGTDIIQSGFGGTGNGFTKFSGAASTEKTYTLPNASSTILTDNAVVTSGQGGTGINNGGRTLTIGTNSGTLAFSAASKTITFGNSITFNGTDATVMTFPTTSATIARTDVAQVFVGHNTFEGVTPTGATGTALMVFSSTPTIASPIFTGEVSLPAASTTTSPVNVPSGTVETASEAGDVLEFDGNAFYGSSDAGNRGVISLNNVIRQDAAYTLANVGTEQKLFNASTNGRVTLETGTYFFECVFSISAMSATSGNAAFDILGAGGATLGTVLYHVTGVDGNTATAGTQTGSTMIQGQTPASMVTAGTGTTLNASLRGTFEVTVAGTIVPSVTLVTAIATAAVAAGSYFRVRRVGSTTLTTIGQWD